MSTILWLLLLIGCAGMMVASSRKPGGIYQFPFIASTCFLGFIGLPSYGLLRHYAQLPDFSVERFLVMTCLCVFGVWLGDRLGGRENRAFSPATYNPRRWMVGMTLLTVAGLGAYLRQRQLFQAEASMVTGETVAYNFFVPLLRYGFIMSMLMYFVSRAKYAGLCLLAGLPFYLDSIVLFGKRSILVELGFTVLLGVWFTYRRAIPKTVMYIGIVVMGIATFATGEYRDIVVSTSGERDWTRVSQLKPAEIAVERVSAGTRETEAGLHMMAASAHYGEFDWGVYHWNRLVANFIPAQVVGEKVKAGLYLPMPDYPDLARKAFGYEKGTGSTSTGVADCYNSFWYLGWLKYLVIAFAMCWLYKYADRGDIAYQALYIYMISRSISAITHQTSSFVQVWPHILCFWLPFMYWAQVRRPAAVIRVEAPVPPRRRPRLVVPPSRSLPKKGPDGP